LLETARAFESPAEGATLIVWVSSYIYRKWVMGDG